MRPLPSLPTRRAVTAGLALTLVTFGRDAPAFGQKPSAAEPRVLTWRAKPAKVRLKPEPAPAVDLWTFEGSDPGSVLRLRRGPELRLTLFNETPQPLSVHWHGVRGANAMDGVGGLTQEPIASGQPFEYRLTPREPGTFLVRPCIPGRSSEPLERGLSAALIIEEDDPPQIDIEFVLLVDDWLLSEDGSLSPFGGPDQASGRLGNLITVNRNAAPLERQVRPGSRIRIRLLNASNARILRVRFDGLKPYVAAIDGQPTDTFEPLRASVPFAPGSRYDFLLDMPSEAGTSGAVTAMLGQGIPLLTLRTEGPPRPSLPAIAPLPPNRTLPAAIRLQNAARKDLVIRGGPDAKPVWTVNGVPGDPKTPLMSVRRGAPVVLALKNETPFVQPLHLHGHVFRLLHPFDDGWEPYFLDTVQVPEGRTIRIAFNADNPGKWLLASTVMERFDAGLWTWIEVA